MIVLGSIIIGIFIMLFFINFYIFLCRKFDRIYLSFALYFLSISNLFFIKWLYPGLTIFDSRLDFALFSTSCYLTVCSILFMICSFLKIKNHGLLVLYTTCSVILGICLAAALYLYYYLHVDLFYQVFIIPASCFALIPVAHFIKIIFINKSLKGRIYQMIFFSFIMVFAGALFESFMLIQNSIYVILIKSVFFISSSVLFMFALVDQFNKEFYKVNPVTDFVLKEYNLSEREREVVELLGDGSSYNEIAQRLTISAKTVETHVYSIYRKTGSKNRLQLLSVVGINN